MNLNRFVQAIKRIYVNLIDLEHAGHKGNAEVVQKFPTEVELSEYTKHSKKIYWRDFVHRGSLLELLLRHIWFPRPEKVETSRNRKRAKRSIKRACSGPQQTRGFSPYSGSRRNSNIQHCV